MRVRAALPGCGDLIATRNIRVAAFSDEPIPKIGVVDDEERPGNVGAAYPAAPLLALPATRVASALLLLVAS
jgi:hypothetical protein